jgi:dihydroneopterin aldolase
MDIIYLNGLTVETIIGIFDWERTTKQKVIFDFEMSADVHTAAQTDRIEDTVDYKAMAKRVIQFVEENEFFLVETLAERVAALVQDEFGVRWLRLKLNKPGAVRYAGDVGVVIERGVKTDGPLFCQCGQQYRP